MRGTSLVVLLLIACSDSDATIETAYDAGHDAARDASDAHEADAAEGMHRCSVEGCNGDVDAIGSAPGCPDQAPEPGTSCALSEDATCFYCEPGEEELSIAFAYVGHVCSGGAWTVESLVTACD